MGVLVLVLAIMPKGKKQSMYILKAEVPGPTVGKVSFKNVLQFKDTLYYLYSYNFKFGTCTLSCRYASFDSFVSFGAAGTGGFSSKNVSIAYYSSPIIRYILSIGMLMFGLNFNLYYLIIFRKY